LPSVSQLREQYQARKEDRTGRRSTSAWSGCRAMTSVSVMPVRHIDT
jgi:hypothetical protein